jgi:DNA-directed RNA polymerase subunit A"
MDDLPKSVQNQIMELKENLKLNKEQTEKLIEVARVQYEKSRVMPGEAVGVVAAQSLGEPGTQLTLRTKWLAGAREMTVTQGLPRLIELFDARKEPSTPTMTIFLKPSYASSEKAVRTIAMKILDITLGDVAKEINVDLLRMRIEVELDSEKMKYFVVKEKQIYDSVTEAFKTAKITTGSYKINIKPKGEEESDIRQLYKLKVKLRDTHVSGVKGIVQVLPDKKGNDWIIKTAGSNLKEILKMDEVNIENTVTNDIFETASVLGIEAARNAIIDEIQNVLVTQGIDVNIRHIMLIADMMTNDGAIKGIGRYGLSGEKTSVLARASFEVPMKHLFNAALHNEADDLKSVVENVMLNQPIPVGTGMVNLVVSRPEGTTGKKEKKEKGE